MKKYHKDYQWNNKNEPGEEQELSYTGCYYEITFYKDEPKKIILLHTLLTLGAFFLQICAGFVNNSGNRNFFIAVPYAFLFLPFAYLIMTLFPFFRLKEKMKREEYDRAVGRGNRSLNGIIALIIYLAAAAFIYIRNKGNGLINKEDYVFLLIIMITGIITLCHKKYLYHLSKRFMISNKKT